MPNSRTADRAAREVKASAGQPKAAAVLLNGWYFTRDAEAFDEFARLDEPPAGKPRLSRLLREGRPGIGECR